MSGMWGVGHRQVLADLDARIGGLAAGEDRPRVVVLQGASGVGKSRIVRELYRWWADHQPAPGYWPALPEIGAAAAGGAGQGSAAAALANRKVIGPPTQGFVWPAGALPAFTWWPFNCASMSTGDAVDVVAQARPSVQAHLGPAVLAWRTSTTVTQRLGGLDEAAGERFREILTEGRDVLLEQALDALGVVVPGLGLVVDWGTRGVKTIHRRRAQAKALAGTVDLGAAAATEQDSAAVQLAQLILSVTCPSLPAVVVVEDLHLMGDSFAQFLRVLQTRNPARPVLVVGTAWPEAHDRGVYATWRDTAHAAGQLDVVDVPDLPAADLHRFVHQAAPHTAPGDADRLVAHYPNPLALQLFLGLDSTRRRITRHHGALPVSQDQLAGLPREDVRDLYRAMWLELPQPVRQTLTLAAGVLPPHTDLTWPFLPQIVTAAAITTGTLQPVDAADTVHRTLHAADSVHHWVLATEPAGAYRFREAVLDDIAAESLGPADRTELTAAAATALRRWIDVRRGTSWQIGPPVDGGTLLIARWLWRLPSADGAVTPADLAAGDLTARALDHAHRPAAARDLMNCRQWRNTYPTDHPANLAIRRFNADRAGKAGRINKAITETLTLVEDHIRVLGPDHPDTFHIRRSLAFLLGEARRLDDAIVEFTSLIEDQVRVLGDDHPETLITRAHLAPWHGRAGRVDAAITDLQTLLADAVKVLGPDHPDTLSIRGNLSYFLTKTGRADDAISQLQTLLMDMIEVLGPDHPSTLNARSHLVALYGHVDSVDDAITEFRVLLNDHIRVLGPDHPDTLNSRRNIAHLQIRGGHDAITEFRDLLNDHIRVLGPDHPDTLTTRASLARLYSRDGQVDEAVREFRRLQADQTGSLGLYHPDTMGTRTTIALVLGNAGKFAEAIAELRILLAETIRFLGPEHLSILQIRNNIALLIGEAGQGDDAVRELRLILAARAQILGPNHPDTLNSRGNLATWIGRTGHIEDAMNELRDLLNDQTRVLGPGHPSTLFTRRNLASWHDEEEPGKPPGDA